LTKNDAEDREYYSRLYKDVHPPLPEVAGRQSTTLRFENIKERGAEERPLFAGRAFIKSQFLCVDNAIGSQWFTSFLTRAEGQFGDRLFPPIRR
jgi:hypothetical protein